MPKPAGQWKLGELKCRSVVHYATHAGLIGWAGAPLRCHCSEADGVTGGCEGTPQVQVADMATCGRLNLEFLTLTNRLENAQRKSDKRQCQ